MDSLYKFKSFLDELSKDNSRTYKTNILTNYKDNDVIKYYLNFIYNPYIVTGISTQKLGRFVVELPYTFKDTQELLEYIKINNTGKYQVLGIISFFKKQLPLYLQTLLDSIICKNLQLGVDVLTINKAIPKLIPTFDVMLANKYFDNPDYVEGKEFSLTTKIDGGRIFAVKEDNEVKFYTRAGQLYEGLVDLENELKQILGSFCLDGELTLLDSGSLDSGMQYKETMKISRKDGEKHGLRMKVFDYVTIDEFKNKKGVNPYNVRREFLNQLFNNYKFKYFYLLPLLYKGGDTSKIKEILNQQVSHGEEGVMININNAPYDFKRTNSLLKVKKMKDLDLEVVGFEEGDNRNKGKLGALICRYKNNTVKVGGGYGDELREEIWNHKEDWLGRTVVVQYFEETVNTQTGLPSLRFPVYIDYREDKKAE